MLSSSNNATLSPRIVARYAHEGAIIVSLSPDIRGCFTEVRGNPTFGSPGSTRFRARDPILLYLCAGVRRANVFKAAYLTFLPPLLSHFALSFSPHRLGAPEIKRPSHRGCTHISRIWRGAFATTRRAAPHYRSIALDRGL